MQLILAEHHCKYSVGCIKAQITQSLTECFMLILVQINRNASIFHLWGRYTESTQLDFWYFLCVCLSLYWSTYSIQCENQYETACLSYTAVAEMDPSYDAISVEHALRWLVWFLSKLSWNWNISWVNLKVNKWLVKHLWQLEKRVVYISIT